MFLKKTAYVLSVLSISSAAMAFGFQISEYSATGLGRSFAGSGLVGDDFSALAYNPAGMQINSTSGVQAGATAIVLHADYRDVSASSLIQASTIRQWPEFCHTFLLNIKSMIV